MTHIRMKKTKNRHRKKWNRRGQGPKALYLCGSDLTFERQGIRNNHNSGNQNMEINVVITN